MPCDLETLLERPMSQRRLMLEFNQVIEPGDQVAVEVELGRWVFDTILKRAEMLKGEAAAVVTLSRSGMVLLSRVRPL